MISAVRALGSYGELRPGDIFWWHEKSEDHYLVIAIAPPPSDQTHHRFDDLADLTLLKRDGQIYVTRRDVIAKYSIPFISFIGDR